MRKVLLSLVLLCSSLLAKGSDIVFIALRPNTMPLVEFHGEVLSGGIVKDLGDAIARKLHRQARFLTLPRNRVEATLVSGEADGICYATPNWYRVPLNWSQPLIPNVDLLVAGTNVPLPRSLSELTGQSIGLVLGYHYPELDAALGNTYRRDDAPDMPTNLHKLVAGRFRYAVIDHLSLAYAARSEVQLAGVASLSLSQYTAQCAFSPKSTIPFRDMNQAIKALVKDGTVERILARYR